MDSLLGLLPFTFVKSDQGIILRLVRNSSMKLSQKRWWPSFPVKFPVGDEDTEGRYQEQAGMVRLNRHSIFGAHGSNVIDTAPPWQPLGDACALSHPVHHPVLMRVATYLSLASDTGSKRRSLRCILERRHPRQDDKLFLHQLELDAFFNSFSSFLPIVNHPSSEANSPHAFLNASQPCGWPHQPLCHRDATGSLRWTEDTAKVFEDRCSDVRKLPKRWQIGA